MKESQHPIDIKGVFRRRCCSYLTFKTLPANELKCTHNLNEDRLCCFSNCPVLDNEQIEKEKKRRNIVKHTPPAPNNTNVSFPKHYKKGRISLPYNTRILDWTGKEWKAFTKEGTQWIEDDFNDDDIETLNDAFIDQIRSL